MSDTNAKNCPGCDRPVDPRKGFFVDHNSGVTMHSTCFLGSTPKPICQPEQLPMPAPEPDRVAA